MNNTTMHKIANAGWDSRACSVRCIKENEYSWYYFNSNPQKCVFCGDIIIVDMEVTVRDAKVMPL